MATTPPLIPRAAITIVALALLGLMGLAVYRGDYLVLLVLTAPLLFILGGDIGSLLRSWRGYPDTPAPEPPTPSPLDKGPS